MPLKSKLLITKLQAYVQKYINKTEWAINYVITDFKLINKLLVRHKVQMFVISTLRRNRLRST